MRNTATEFEFGRGTNDLVGSQGVGKLLGTWQIIDDPSLRFRLGISVWKKVIAVKSVKIDIHRRKLPYWVHCAGGSLPYFFRLSTTHICHQDSDGIYIQIHIYLTSLRRKNNAPCKLAAKLGLV